MENKSKVVRIGIITFHRSINYGAFMQAYALSNYLSNTLNAKIEIIDFEYLKKNILQKLIVLKRSRIIYLYKYFQQFIQFRKSLGFLPLSSKTFINPNYKKIEKYINSNYDIVIVGSDGVWAYNSFKLGIDNIYFLRGIKIKKLSYAATAFGLDFDNVAISDREYINESLKNYIYIGVRDTGTYKFIQEISDNKKIHLNCDPTFLLEGLNKSLAYDVLKRHNIVTNKPIIGLMIDSEIISKKIREIYGDKYLIISIFNHNKYADYFLHNLNPIEWSNIFSIFSIVFSSYFHGSILSLKNSIPVIAFQGYPYREKYISKIEQVFKDLSLEEYCFILERINENNIYDVFNVSDYILDNRDEVVNKIIIGVENEKKKILSLTKILENEISRLSNS